MSRARLCPVRHLRHLLSAIEMRWDLRAASLATSVYLRRLPDPSCQTLLLEHGDAPS